MISPVSFGSGQSNLFASFTMGADGTIRKGAATTYSQALQEVSHAIEQGRP